MSSKSLQLDTKKQIKIAWITSLIVVGLARLLHGFGLMLGFWMLLPGGMANFLFFGAHKTWEGLISELLLLVPSAIAWFIFVYVVLILIEKPTLKPAQDIVPKRDGSLD